MVNGRFNQTISFIYQGTLSKKLRHEHIEKIKKIISDYGLSKTGVLNIRNAAFSKEIF